MHRAVKTVLGVVAGVLAGSLANGGIIGRSAHVIPPPPGTDVSTMEGLKWGSLAAGPAERLTPIILRRDPARRC